MTGTYRSRIAASGMTHQFEVHDIQRKANTEFGVGITGKCASRSRSAAAG